MARARWLIDSKRFATKIKNPSFVPSEDYEKSGVTRECPHCSYQIDNSDLFQKWPGLPAGVKFDPSDQELLGHLAQKVGNAEPHPFIDEFIPTLQEDEGICYTHPENLPGVKQNGSPSHFFHITANAYLRGNRKRRKINCGDNQSRVEVRWHKTGNTRPVIENGIQRGWKKIMVLYMGNGKGGKQEKTNWAMHQYHLGTEEDEKETEYVVSKIFYQQQSKQLKKKKKPKNVEGTSVTKGGPVTPRTTTPELPRHGKGQADLDMDTPGQVADFHMANHEANVNMGDLTWNDLNDQANVKYDDPTNLSFDSAWLGGESQPRMYSQPPREEFLFCDENLRSSSREKMGSEEPVPGLAEPGRIEAEGLQNDQANAEYDDSTFEAVNDPANLSFDPAWLEGESQPRMDSQPPTEEFLFCDENLPSSYREKMESEKLVPGLAEHGRIEAEGLEHTANASYSTSILDNIELDTPPDLDTIDLQFNSQESLSAWTNGVI